VTPIQPPVPTYWSGDQALEVADFLEQLIAAIWYVHGNKMTVAAGFMPNRPDSEPPDTSDLPF
jgi:hypothetical protein